MTKATRLILVRHAETAPNRELRYLGRRDDELTARGQQQATLLAEALAALPIAALYTSPRRRARDTAQSIADRLEKPLAVADALQEHSFGAWEGMTRAEVLTHSDAFAEHLHAWEADDTIAPPDGESWAAMTARVTSFAASLCGLHAGETVALVSHVGPIKALVAATLQIAPAARQQMFLDPATISVVDWSNTGRTLRLFNSHAHLGWTAARWMEQ